MNGFDAEIPEASLEKDFTIIYKGREERDGKIIEPIEEIKTLKFNFFHKLRYFKSHIYEHIQTNEMFIHDTYPIETFKLFINSISTNKIRLDENNYSNLYKLSSKYQYYELQKQIDAFSKTRPDVQQVVNNYTFDEIDSLKEEKLAKNLDICLQNPNMINFPLHVLNRILNSPNRVLNNHHLLFNFIKEVINKNASNENSNDNDNFQILFGSLDYLQMSNDELEELFSNKHFDCIFGCRNSKEQMKTFIEERKFNQMRMSQLEEEMKNLSSLVTQKIESFENNERESQDKIELMERKLASQEQKINQSQSEKQDLLDIIHRMEEKLNELEEKVKIRPITGSITAGVESNQIIKGTINLVEYNTRLDTDKSKYIINTSSEQMLGERAYESGVAIDSLSKNFSFSKGAGTYYVHAFIVDNLGNTCEIISGPLRTNGVAPLTFGYTGSVQSVTLEPGDYKLEVWGAEGGKNSNNTTPGKGGYSVGTLPLKSRTKLYIHVGQSPTNGIGGWNGGGSTGTNYAGGGGATDISLYGSEGSSDWNNSNHLFSRIIVAGGGGGSGNNQQFLAGCGGGVNGQNSGGCSNSGGTQTSAGMSSKSSGQGFGVGGKQTRCCSGGGGGGWYGGASSDANNGCGTGSGGGSGYVYSSSTASIYPSGCMLNSSFYLINATTIAGNCSFPNTSGSSNETGHNGDGYAKITLI